MITVAMCVSQSRLPGNNRSVLSRPTISSLSLLLSTPVAAFVELRSRRVSGRALGESESGASCDGPEETHQVGEGQVQGEVHLGEEVEIHQ